MAVAFPRKASWFKNGLNTVGLSRELCIVFGFARLQLWAIRCSPVGRCSPFCNTDANAAQRDVTHTRRAAPCELTFQDNAKHVRCFPFLSLSFPSFPLYSYLWSLLFTSANVCLIFLFSICCSTQLSLASPNDDRRLMCETQNDKHHLQNKWRKKESFYRFTYSVHFQTMTTLENGMSRV